MEDKCETEPGGYQANSRHHYFKDKTNESGYAVCSACGCAENDALATHYCRWWINTQIGILLQGNKPPFNEAPDYINDILKKRGRGPTEKDRRLYYQDIVYHICNCLDRIFSKTAANGTGVVCGNTDFKSAEVAELMNRLTSFCLRPAIAAALKKGEEDE